MLSNLRNVELAYMCSSLTAYKYWGNGIIKSTNASWNCVNLWVFQTLCCTFKWKNIKLLFQRNPLKGYLPSETYNTMSTIMMNYTSLWSLLGKAHRSLFTGYQFEGIIHLSHSSTVHIGHIVSIHLSAVDVQS